MKKHLIEIAGLMAALAFSLVGCAGETDAQGERAGADAAAGTQAGTSAEAATTAAAALDLSSQRFADADISTQSSYEDSTDGGHAITADGESAGYSNASVGKTGDSDGDEADFYGENAAVFATNGATLDLSDLIATTDGTHANGVFSYGDGTTVNVSHSIIRTAGNCSGGLMTTGGGIMNATDVTAETQGNSSAAIRSDRGGGDVNVTGGYYTTAGTGSPAIYSTADISVQGAYLQSSASQGVVVEGKNSVALTDCQLIASNTTKNSDKSDYYQAVMIYQSMSGDADSGTSSFSMDGGTLTNENGDVFFVNNTLCRIDLTDAAITNDDASGVFLRAAAAGWGTQGSNGGNVTLNASSQAIDGDMLVDDVSALNLYLQDGSSFSGAVNPSGQEGDVYVELDANSTWTLTGDSYVTSLTCVPGSIDLNGHTLYVNGVAYDGASASAGEAVDMSASA
ncbi:putative lipoprotein [Slackia sp. CM382]|uniref:hypothetical protein n=1 Tax=Slackia sp. CM382 TaxID=1111137 RepID=UPI00027C6AFD|nr:hypothetical protein [Slackia sp. CM382]EJU35408.1 putative lipoprotein [Slackia sp. CM382]